MASLASPASAPGHRPAGQATGAQRRCPDSRQEDPDFFFFLAAPPWSVSIRACAPRAALSRPGRAVGWTQRLLLPTSVSGPAYRVYCRHNHVVDASSLPSAAAIANCLPCRPRYTTRQAPGIAASGARFSALPLLRSSLLPGLAPCGHLLARLCLERRPLPTTADKALLCVNEPLQPSPSLCFALCLSLSVYGSG